jgi:hypothetical protein
VREGRRRRLANLGKVPASYDPLRAAFYVSWDANSLASLKKHYKDIDLLMPEELHTVTTDGELTIVDYERYQTVQATPMEAVALLKDDKLHQWMKATNVELPMMGLLNNYDGVVWHVKELAGLLRKADARRTLIENTVEYAVQAHEAGIVVDIVLLSGSWRRRYMRSG